MAHAEGNVVIHLIFSTKDRKPLITPEFRSDLFACMGGIVREMRAAALIVNGTENRLHRLIRIRPSQSAAEIARVVKTNSPGWVRRVKGFDFSWQTGYGVFSVSESNIAEVAKYIATQEDHYKKQLFQEEFEAFLKKNNIP